MHKLFSDREQQCQLTGREKERLLLGKLVSLSRQTDFKVWARIKYLSACLPDLLPHMPTPEMLQWPSGSASAYYGEGGASNGVFEEAEATINTIQVGEAQSVALCLYSTHFIIIQRAHRCQGINSLTLPHATLRTHAHTHIQALRTRARSTYDISVSLACFTRLVTPRQRCSLYIAAFPSFPDIGGLLSQAAADGAAEPSLGGGMGRTNTGGLMLVD